jgi:hypothetical protein
MRSAADQSIDNASDLNIIDRMVNGHTLVLDTLLDFSATLYSDLAWASLNRSSTQPSFTFFLMTEPAAAPYSRPAAAPALGTRK